MAKASDNQFPKVTLAESAAPATPGTGLGFLYEKTDNKLYFKNDAGTETELTAAGTAIVQLADTLLGSDTANFDFTSISGSYKHLRIEVQGRSAVVATNDNILMIFNNDSGANYDYLEWAFGTGSGFPAALGESFAGTSIRAMNTTGASSTAGDVGNATITIPDYASTTFNKTSHSEGGVLFARSAQNIRIMQCFGSWRSTAAITRITLTPAGGNWKAGSRATLYGLA